DQLELPVAEPPDALLPLNEALDKLAQEDELCAELVKLRVFAGLTLAETARALGIARRSADRYWAFARSWLYEELRQGEAPESLCREKKCVSLAHWHAKRGIVEWSALPEEPSYAWTPSRSPRHLL